MKYSRALSATATLVTRLVPFGLWRHCMYMFCFESLVQFGSSGVQSVRSGDVFVRGVML